MPTCNNTLEKEYINEDSLWKGFTFHHFGLFLAAVFGGIAVVVASYLIAQHALHYLKPWEQRHIIRILFMIPIYGVVSFLSYLYYRHAIYFDVLESCYEAFAISSFFTLLCNYVAPTVHDQKEYFRTLKPKNWVLKFNGFQYIFGRSFLLLIKGRTREAAEYGELKGPFRKPRSGLTWFNTIWTGVFQYCVIRVFFTIVAVITQLFGVYCEDSLSPAFAHVWVTVIEAVSVTIAMLCLIQFYVQLKTDLAEHKPFLKILCIKLVIFFSFWQTTLISFLTSANGPLKPSNYVSYPDLKVGIPAVMLCIEMAVFAIMHLWAFPWKTYSIKRSYNDPLNVPGSGFSGNSLSYKGGPLGIMAIADAFNPWDIIKAIGRGFKFLFVGYKHRTEDISYQPTPTKQDSSYVGPTYAGTGEAATELRTSADPPRRGRPQNFGSSPEGDDTAGLLSNPSKIARQPSNSPYRADSNDDYYHPTAMDDSQLDLGHGPTGGYRPAPAYNNNTSSLDLKPFHDQQDTSYHPGFGPGSAPSGPGAAFTSGAPYRGATASPLHPALREQGIEEEQQAGHVPQSEWNFFGGAAGSGGAPAPTHPNSGYGNGRGPPPGGWM